MENFKSSEYDLPCQRQPPSLDSTPGIVFSRGAKFDILRRLIFRKDPLHPFIEFLGKCVQILGRVEFGPSQFSWSWIEQVFCKKGIRMHLVPSLLPLL